MSREDHKIGGKPGCIISLKNNSTKYMNQWKQEAYKYTNEHTPFPKCTWFDEFRNGSYDIILESNEDKIQTQNQAIVNNLDAIEQC